MLKVITVTNTPNRAKPLIDSLEKYGWEYVLINTPWRGFGTKLISTYEYLKAHPEVDRFIFSDAHDVVCMGTPKEFEGKLSTPDDIVLNAERGCWPPPVQHFEHLFFKDEPGFNYLNSGVYYAPSKLFMAIFEANPPSYETDDQWWFSMVYLFGNWYAILDYEQKLFNCHSFIRDGEYGYENGRIQILGNSPIFIHSNGATVDEKLNELLK